MEKEFTEWFEKNEKRFAHGQFDEKQIAYSAWLEGQNQALHIHAVSGSFSQKDMENFAAKCMLLGHCGKTTNELLQDFCDNDR